MTSVSSAITDFRYAMLRLSEGSQREYKRKLLVFQAWCEGQGLEVEDIKQSTIRRFVEHLRTRTDPRYNTPISNSTIHGYLRILKVFLNWLGREEDYEGLVRESLTRRIEMPKVEQKTMGVFSDQQIAALLDACESEESMTLRVRDRAIVCVLLDTGIRIGELCSLTLDNTFLDIYDAHLKVHGKGNKWREVPLGKKSLAALRRYITRYRHGHPDEKSVFLSRSGKPMTVWGLERVIARLSEIADIQPRELGHPHTFRHTCAVRYLEATGDIYRLSRLLGHTSVKITEIYVRAASNKSTRSGVSVLDMMR